MRDTRERLLEATRMLLIERGVLEVSIAEITQRAEANVALVSYHFNGREGLMLAVAKADAALALEDLDRLLAADLAPSEKIRRHITGIIRAYAKRPYLNRLLQKLLREGTHEAAAQVGSFFVHPVAIARRRIIEAGIATGEFRDVNAALVSFAIDGACAQIFTSPEAREAVLGDGAMNDDLLERYATSTADLFIAGLRPSSTA
jgi:TetR/AcrR family transcriptional regulator